MEVTIDQNQPDTSVPRETELTFNVVYTPGAFKHQSLFLLSMLKHLNCSFLVVANGCDAAETQRMQSFCEQKSRLEFLALPFPKMLHHSKVLSYLQQFETSDYFCFMDSDILATGNFLTPMLPLLTHHSAVFSGRPLWQTEEKAGRPAGQNRLMGRYLWSTNGFFLGCSYFAIYNNRRLGSVIEEIGVGFDNTRWEALPPRAKLLMVKMGQRAAYYDTAKVLNILMQEAGFKLVQQESEYLHHIGGLSSGVLRGPQGHINPSNPPPKETKIKRVVNSYFLKLLAALTEGVPLPPVPEINDEWVLNGTRLTKDHIVSYAAEFNGQF